MSDKPEALRLAGQLESGEPAIQGVDYPKCFDSREEWDGWKQSARTCGESCNICNDCTHAYRYEMQLQGRCDRTIFWGFVPKKSNVQND